MICGCAKYPTKGICGLGLGEDYAAFSSKEELLDKIGYYLIHEDEREKIAASGKRKAMQLWNGEVFWGAVLDSLGVNFN